MKKILLLLIVAVLFHLTGAAQQTSSVEERQKKAAEEIRSELVAKLALSDKAAGKILKIEAEFRTKLAAIEATGNITTVEKEKRRNEVFVARYGEMMDVPLTGRQMEDAIELIALIRQRHKL